MKSKQITHNGVNYSVTYDVTKGMKSMSPLQPDDPDEITIISVCIVNDNDDCVIEIDGSEIDDKLPNWVVVMINDEIY